MKRFSVSINDELYRTREEAETVVGDYLDGWMNPTDRIERSMFSPPPPGVKNLWHYQVLDEYGEPVDAVATIRELVPAYTREHKGVDFKIVFFRHQDVLWIRKIFNLEVFEYDPHAGDEPVSQFTEVIHPIGYFQAQGIEIKYNTAPGRKVRGIKQVWRAPVAFCHRCSCVLAPMKGDYCPTCVEAMCPICGNDRISDDMIGPDGRYCNGDDCLEFPVAEHGRYACLTCEDNGFQTFDCPDCGR